MINNEPSKHIPGLPFWLLTLIWFTTILLIGERGVFQQATELPLTHLQLAIITPMAIFWALYGAIPAFRRYVLGIDFLFLNLIQTWRVLGGAILVMWGYGLVPGGFALPMSILDMSVGVLAVNVVLAIARGEAYWRVKAWTLNLWGSLDFLVTILLALFAYRALPIDPPLSVDLQASLSLPPLALFPAFAIPFFSCLHFCAIAQLANRTSKTNVSTQNNRPLGADQNV
jgi:hypothetical protein